MRDPDASTEVNFDGLIGPTHNFAGLAPGNLASLSHRNQISNPHAAARQGIAKMSRLRQLGIPQAVLPPQPRPNLGLLRRLGFRGDDAAVLSNAQRESPHLLAIAMSGSSMWTANAATFSPSADSIDGRAHFTPANLVTSLHRASESDLTGTILKRVFHDDRFFAHHDALPPSSDMGDEGAANHTRFCTTFDDPGVQMFVYGSERGASVDANPSRFPARQSRESCGAIIRLHRLDPARVVLAKQNPVAIDAGVFHNDVIAVGHRRQLLCHQDAFANPERVFDDLRRASDGMIRIVEVPGDRLSLSDAVATYLFNSQIVTTPAGETVLIAPDHCRTHVGVKSLVDQWIAESTIDNVEFVDVTESMNNGGGPACLRLRVVLTPEQLASIEQGVLLTDELEVKLEDWIDRYYRRELSPEDLADPLLMKESFDALDALTEILGLGCLYEFQH